MNLLWLLVVLILIFAVVGAPNFGYHNYGWGPSGVGTVVVILLVLYLLGVFR